MKYSAARRQVSARDSCQDPFLCSGACVDVFVAANLGQTVELVVRDPELILKCFALELKVVDLLSPG